MEKQTILAMYSGGLDSLGMLYKLFTEKEYSDYSIHIHHIHNRNIERRDLAEAVITQGALNEFRVMGFDFIYSESGISSPIYGGEFMYDSDLINFFGGYICSVNKDITKIAMGMNSTDMNVSLAERRKRADKILWAFTDVDKIYPVFNCNKLEIWNTLPVNLRDKFWSCRTPKIKNGNVSPCEKCHTCLQLLIYGIPHITL